jgi:hypothetical protein
MACPDRWPAARNPGCGFGEEYSGRSRRWRCPWRHRWRHRLSCRLSSRRPPRAQSLVSTASGPMAPPHQPPASGWCCCHMPKSSPPTPTHSHRTGRATGMNRDDFPRQYQTLSLVDNAPQTWGREVPVVQPIRCSTCSPTPGHAAKAEQSCGATSARARFQVPVESNRNLGKSRASAASSA